MKPNDVLGVAVSIFDAPLKQAARMSYCATTCTCTLQCAVLYSILSKLVTVLCTVQGNWCHYYLFSLILHFHGRRPRYWKILI